MGRKRKYILIVVIICAVVMIAGAAFLIKRNTVVDENIVTRYEWLEMLGEQFEFSKYTENSPYFGDVDSENPYFAYVQSAAEWKIIDAASDFGGESYASGQFIVLTTMKTIGENKLRIYLENDNAVTDDTYVDLAMEYGLIKEDKLKKGFSREECELVLEKLTSLYFGALWKDDYSSIAYQGNIIELNPQDILQSDADCSEIRVAEDMVDSVEAGTIIVFEQGNTKLKIAREITEIDSDGTLSLSAVELERVVESLTVSDVTELTFEDIINYYGLEEKDAVDNLVYQQTDISFDNTTIFPNQLNSKGFKLSLSTTGEGKDRHLKLQITDNATGISYSLPISDKVEEGDEYSAEMDIDKLYIGGQISYSIGNGLEYAEAAIDAHAAFKSTIKAEKEKKFLLCKIPVPLGGGVVGVDVQIYLVLSVEGGISFEAELPVEISVFYEKDRGLRNLKNNISVGEPRIEANCGAGAMLRLEPTFVILGCLNVMDVEADIGVTASAEVITRTNSQICADISIAFPVMTLAVCGDHDADTLIGNLGLSAEWKIISSENAPVQRGLHFELLTDKRAQFVDKCTYGESEEIPLENVKQESSLSDETSEFIKYSTYELPILLWITAPIEELGEYYMVKGDLWVEHAILCKDFDKLSEGDHFIDLDKEFILGEQLQMEEFPASLYSVYCVDDECTYYIQTKVSFDSGSRFGDSYYPICLSVPDFDWIGESITPVYTDLGVQEFKIAKDTYFTSSWERWIWEKDHGYYKHVIEGGSSEESFAYRESQRKELLEKYAHAAENCYNSHILIDDWIDIADFDKVYQVYFFVYFDENGDIDTFIFNSVA